VRGAWHKFSTAVTVLAGAEADVGMSNTMDIFGKRRGRARCGARAQTSAAAASTAASAATKVNQTEDEYRYEHLDCPLGYHLPRDRRKDWWVADARISLSLSLSLSLCLSLSLSLSLSL
jgi:hypothetical protein